MGIYNEQHEPTQMTRATRWATAMIGLLVLTGQASGADDPSGAVIQTLNAFGMRGIWAHDCYRTMTAANPRIRINIDFLPQSGVQIVTQKSTNITEDEMMTIKDAKISEDLLTLKIKEEVYFGDGHGLPLGIPAQGRTDTYQMFGARLRLMRSEITWLSPASVAEGLKIGLVTDNGFSPPIDPKNLPPYMNTPLLERCAE